MRKILPIVLLYTLFAPSLLWAKRFQPLPPPQTECLLLRIDIYIHFDPGSSVIKKRVLPFLTQAADEIRANRRTIAAVEVEGFTDSQESPKHEQQLSQKRAEAVAAFLTEADVAVPVTAIGMGSQPPFTNHGVEDREQSRRVQFKLIHPEPKESPCIGTHKFPCPPKTQC